MRARLADPAERVNTPETIERLRQVYAERLRDLTWVVRFKAKISRARRKLTDAQVRELRALKGSVTRTEAARRFGVSKTTVGRIRADPARSAPENRLQRANLWPPDAVTSGPLDA